MPRGFRQAGLTEQAGPVRPFVAMIRGVPSVGGGAEGGGGEEHDLSDEVLLEDAVLGDPIVDEDDSAVVVCQPCSGDSPWWLRDVGLVLCPVLQR